MPEASRYFITINCRTRGPNQLCRDEIAVRLIASIPVYEELGKWFVYVMVVMPDHVHLIASFNLRLGIRSILKPWKSFHTKQSGIEWQDDFFEHRLRDEHEFIEKAHYVRMNPVRKGLVSKWKAWPHTWTRGEW